MFFNITLWSSSNSFHLHLPPTRIQFFPLHMSFLRLHFPFFPLRLPSFEKENDLEHIDIYFIHIKIYT